MPSISKLIGETIPHVNSTGERDIRIMIVS